MFTNNPNKFERKPSEISKLRRSFLQRFNPNYKRKQPDETPQTGIYIRNVSKRPKSPFRKYETATTQEIVKSPSITSNEPQVSKSSDNKTFVEKSEIKNKNYTQINNFEDLVIACVERPSIYSQKNNNNLIYYKKRHLYNLAGSNWNLFSTEALNEKIQMAKQRQSQPEMKKSLSHSDLVYEIDKEKEQIIQDKPVLKSKDSKEPEIKFLPRKKEQPYLDVLLKKLEQAEAKLVINKINEPEVLKSNKLKQSNKPSEKSHKEPTKTDTKITEPITRNLIISKPKSEEPEKIEALLRPQEVLSLTEIIKPSDTNPTEKNFHKMVHFEAESPTKDETTKKTSFLEIEQKNLDSEKELELAEDFMNTLMLESVLLRKKIADGDDDLATFKRLAQILTLKKRYDAFKKQKVDCQEREEILSAQLVKANKVTIKNDDNVNECLPFTKKVLMNSQLKNGFNKKQFLFDLKHHPLVRM